MDRPARQVLRLPGETAIPWAVFDAAWYRATYPEAPDASPEDLLGYYLGTGQGLGHSPNRLFDEVWHRSRYPRLTDAIAAGHYASAFDSYCRRGCLDRSAHWLFEELLYRRSHPDLTDEVLAEAELANGYDHYLRHGVTEDRAGHPLFDPAVYLDNFDPIDARAIRESGAFQHYLARIETLEPELRTSIYFDPDWYLRRYPEVAEAIGAGRWKSALHHYLCNDQPTDFDPCDSFSEKFYLAQDPGLLPVIAAGHFRNGYAHFIRFGAQELRRPSADLDLRLYAEQPQVRADLERGVEADAFRHWLRFGTLHGRAALTRNTLTDEQARVGFRRSALALLPIAGRCGYAFDADDAACAVVLAPRDGFALTMAAIAALHAASGGAVAPILIDRGSTDETRNIDRYIPGARVVRFDDDIGPVAAANAGWQLATAPYVLFLGADARLCPGAVARAMRRLDADETIGAVAGMLIQPRGGIGQAGGIVWSDGGLHDYQRGEDPLTPEANFVRAVDFGSLACLMVRRATLAALDGLDDTLDSDHAAADLGLRLAAAGLRVIYDPCVQAVHDGPASADAPVSPAFAARHQAALTAHRARGGAVQVFARHAGPPARRVLFLDDTIPLRRLGSGFVRSNDVVHALTALGCDVTVFPVNGCPHDPAQVFGDLPETTEAMHAHAANRLKTFLEGRRGYYDFIWVCRLHNLNRIRPVLTALRDGGGLQARLILDTEAVTPTRDAVEARLADRPFDLDQALDRFAADAADCHTVIAVTESEAALLRARSLARVAIIGHMITPRPTPRPFADRAGLLFVGAIHSQDSPNHDSLAWFADHVLPMLEPHLGWAARLTVVGYIAPGVDMSRFEANPRITLRGPVTDLTPLYDRHRLFIAPTRYAAGAPYKVLDAAAHGLPIVATPLLAEELGWSTGTALLAAPADDAAAFAGMVVALYNHEDAWAVLRANALERLARDHGRDGFIAAVGAALPPPETISKS